MGGEGFFPVKTSSDIGHYQNHSLDPVRHGYRKSIGSGYFQSMIQPV